MLRCLYTYRRWRFFSPMFSTYRLRLFGYAFALTVFGFITGSLINARLVMRFGMNQTLKAGLAISLLCAGVIVVLSANASDYLYVMAALSSIFFLGVGLTSSNASMGAISLYAHRAGSASAVYGFTHALLASAVGAVAGLALSGPPSRARLDHAGVRDASLFRVVAYPPAKPQPAGGYLARWSYNAAKINATVSAKHVSPHLGGARARECRA